MERWRSRTGGGGRTGPVGAHGDPAAEPVSTLRVLVAGEGEASRPRLADLLAAEPGVRVVAAVDGGALEVARRERPDLVCLDLHAPGMDALGFLQDLMREQPTPVVVVANGHGKAEVFRALELGALEFVSRPQGPGGTEAFEEDLRARVRMVRGLRLDDVEPAGPEPRAAHAVPERLVVIGAAGTEAGEVTSVLADLLPGVPLAVLVAQHAPAASLATARAGRGWGLRFAEASDGRALEAGDVLVAPAGRHLQVERVRGAVSVRVLEPSEVAGRRHCPSIDLLFESAARSFADRACGVLLDGTGGDGRRGAVAVRTAGGLVLAERRSAHVEADPDLLARFDEVLLRGEIPRRLLRFARGG